MRLLATNSQMLLEKSMGFLWTKQAAILDNIANAETPNYKEKVVTFEEDLRAKIQTAAQGAAPRRQIRQTLEDAEVTVTEQMVSTRMDDNGVNVTTQSIEAVRNAFQLRYVMRSLNTDMSVLLSAVRGQ